MYWLNRFKMLFSPGSILLFYRSHRLMKDDDRYSIFNLITALWKVSKNDKIQRHKGTFIHSSFLPPIPTAAAYQVLSSVAGVGTVYEDHICARRCAPISLYVAVTNKCNYNCEHCSVAGDVKDDEWKKLDLLKLFSDLQEMGTAIIGITGGEPLLREDLCELIAGIDKRSITYLFSSGQGLSAKKAQDLSEAGLFGVGISLDSDDRNTMDSFRGIEGAFDSAVEAVLNCKAAGLYTMTQIVATPGALRTGQLEKIIKFSSSLGVHEVRILESMPTGRLAKVDSSMILSKKEREDLKEFHIQMNRKWNYPKVSVFAHTESHSNFGCGAGTQHSYIDSSGNLYPCDFVPLAFGNVRKKHILNLWRQMNEAIKTPRKNCMILELSDKKLLDSVHQFPIPVDYSMEYIQKLDNTNDMPGFYKALSGKK